MLRVSKLTDYATEVMTVLAAAPARVHNAQELAERARLEAPTVSKLLKQLAQAGLVESFRGVNGGYRLARDPAQISIADIVDRDGRPDRHDRVQRAGRSVRPRIALRRARELAAHQRAIAGALAGVSLADMLKTRAAPAHGDDSAARGECLKDRTWPSNASRSKPP